MKYPEGSISEIELANMYGKEILNFAKPFIRQSHIISPFAYQAFMELALWSTARSDEHEKYEKWISTYVNDAHKRFEGMKSEITRFIFKEGLATMLSIPYITQNHSVTNLYGKYFKNTKVGKKFVLEKVLEDVLYDSFYHFDLGETLTVKKQKDTNAGPVDLMLKHKDNVYLIELKKGKAKRKDVYQSLDYEKGYDRELDEKTHPILIAHEFDEDVIALAKESGVSCYRYFVGLDIPDTLVVLEGMVPDKDFTELYDYIVSQTGDIVSTLPDFSMDLNTKANEIMNKFNKTIAWINYCLEKYEKGA